MGIDAVRVILPFPPPPATMLYGIAKPKQYTGRAEVFGANQQAPRVLRHCNAKAIHRWGRGIGCE